jgi:integrase/recombinase XerD
MTELRRRMIQAMTIRGFSPRTHESYIAAVRRLAKHYRRSPDELSVDEVQAYLAHMVVKQGLSWSTCNIAAQAFRFLYHVTLGRDSVLFEVPAPKQSQLTACSAIVTRRPSCTPVRDTSGFHIPI